MRLYIILQKLIIVTLFLSEGSASWKANSSRKSNILLPMETKKWN